MTKLGAEEPEDAQPPANLWTRLVTGRVTEVCVLSYRGLYRDLPQTLGLEVIQYDSYIYDTRGVTRTPEERERVARQFAAEARWLAINGPRYWVEPFAKRAEVILVMPGGVGTGLSALNLTASAAIGLRWSHWASGRKSRRGGTEPLQDLISTSMVAPIRDDYGDAPMTNDQIAAYYVTMRNYFVGTFPQKTLVLDAAGVKLLRSVRALRQG